jgi:hypothetical protein
MHPVQFAISIVLYLVLFFGIGFILNMLLKTTWLPGAVLYPFIVLWIVSDVSLLSYITEPVLSLQHLAAKFGSLTMADVVILTIGFVGALLSGVTIQMLRARGYRMF